MTLMRNMPCWKENTERFGSFFSPDRGSAGLPQAVPFGLMCDSSKSARWKQLFCIQIFKPNASYQVEMTADLLKHVRVGRTTASLV